MKTRNLFRAAALLLPCWAAAQEPATETEAEASEAAAAEERPAADERQADEGPRTMSGMSVLGNEEAPKALVIVPWKTSELGTDLNLSATLDDRARPVDRDVFMRELRYYNLRSEE